MDRHQHTRGLTFKEAVTVCVSKAFNFKDRAPRSEYWWFYLAFFLAITCTIAIDTVLFWTPFNAWFPLTSILYILAIVPLCAVTVRRLHDTDRSGYWFLAAIAVHVFAGLWGGAQQDAFNFFDGLAILSSVVIFVMMVLPGTRGPNTFGPDPLATANDIDPPTA